MYTHMQHTMCQALLNILIHLDAHKKKKKKPFVDAIVPILQV